MICEKLSCYTMFKKTFYYDFIPTKAEEEACKATNLVYRPTKTLVEIRDFNPPPTIDPLIPWVIKKAVSPSEAGEGMIVLSYSETFNNIFRYWSVETTNNVLKGTKQTVVVWDSTDENNPKSYFSVDTYLEAGPECEYFLLGCMDLVRDRRLIAGDDIGLFWDVNSTSFQFRVLSGGIISQPNFK